MEIECRVCKDEFDPEDPFHKKHGFRDECHDCGLKEDRKRKVVRSVGTHGSVNKSGAIEVVKNPSKDFLRQIERQNKAGFNANLPLGNPAKVDTPKDDD